MDINLSQGDLILCAAWLPIPFIENSIIQTTENELFHLSNLSSLPERKDLNSQSLPLINSYKSTKNLLFQCDGIFFKLSKTSNSIAYINTKIQTTSICFEDEISNENQLLLRIGSINTQSSLSFTYSSIEKLIQFSLSNCEINLILNPIIQWIKPLFSLSNHKKQSTKIKTTIIDDKKSLLLAEIIKKYLHFQLLVNLQNSICRIGKEDHSNELLSFLIPNLSIQTLENNECKFYLENSQILLENVNDEPDKNWIFLKGFSLSIYYKLLFNSPSSASAYDDDDDDAIPVGIDIKIDNNPINIKLSKESLEITSKLICDLIKLKSEFLNLPKFKKLKNENFIHSENDKKEERKNIDFIDQFLEYTKDFNISFSILFPYNSLEICNYLFSCNNFNFLFTNQCINSSHGIDLQLKIKNLQIISLNKSQHSLLQLVDNKIFFPPNENQNQNEFLQFSWKITSSNESLSILHKISLVINPLQYLLWFPAWIEISEIIFQIRKIIYYSKISNNVKNTHSKSLSWQNDDEKQVIHSFSDKNDKKLSSSSFSLLKFQNDSSHSFNLSIQIKEIQIIIPSSFSTNSIDLLLFKCNKFILQIESFESSFSSSPNQTINGWKIPNFHSILPIHKIEFLIQNVNLYSGYLPFSSSFHSIQKIKLGDPIPTWLSSFFNSPLSLEGHSISNLNHWNIFQLNIDISSFQLYIYKNSLILLSSAFVSIQKYLRIIKLLLGLSNNKKNTKNQQKQNENKQKPSSNHMIFKPFGLALQIQLESGEIHFIDKNQINKQQENEEEEEEEENNLLFIQFLKSKILFEIGFPYRLHGFIDSLSIQSIQNGRVKEILVRKKLKNEKLSSSTSSLINQEQFLTLKSHCNDEFTLNTININFSSFIFSLDRILTSNLFSFFNFSLLNENLLLNHSFYDQILLECKEFIRFSQFNTQNNENNHLSSNSIDHHRISKEIRFKILLPSCELCLSTLPFDDHQILSKKLENLMLKIQLENILLFYSSNKDDTTLSISSIQFQIGKTIHDLSNLFYPPIQGNFVLYSEIHDKLFYNKRVFICKTNFPLLSTRFSFLHIEYLLDLIQSFKNSIQIPINNKNQKKKLKQVKVNHVDETNIENLSSGDLKVEGLFLEVEKNIQPSSNSVSISSDDNLSTTWMAWCYSEPRAISSIQIQPLPSSLEEENQISSFCEFKLYYFDIIQQNYIEISTWKLSLPHNRFLSFPLSESKEYYSKQWKLEFQNFPFPSSILPITCLIPSYYNPSFSDLFEFHFKIQTSKISFLCDSPIDNHNNHLHHQQQHKKQNLTEDLLVLFLQKSSIQFTLRSGLIQLGWQSKIGIQYIENRFLTSQWFIEPSKIEIFISHLKKQNQTNFQIQTKEKFHCNFSPTILSFLLYLQNKCKQSLFPIIENNKNFSEDHTKNSKKQNLSAAQQLSSSIVNRQYKLINQTNENLFISQFNILLHSICGPIFEISSRSDKWFSYSLLLANLQQCVSIGYKNLSNDLIWSENFSLDQEGWKEIHFPSTNEICWIFIALRGGKTFIHLVGYCLFENLSKIPLQIHLNKIKMKNSNQQQSPSSPKQTQQPTLFSILPNTKNENISKRIENLFGIFNISNIYWQFHCSILSKKDYEKEIDNHSIEYNFLSGIQWQWSKIGIDIPSNVIENPIIKILTIYQTYDQLCFPFICGIFPNFHYLPLQDLSKDKNNNDLTSIIPQGPLTIRFNSLLVFENLLPYEISFYLSNPDPSNSEKKLEKPEDINDIISNDNNNNNDDDDECELLTSYQNIRNISSVSSLNEKKKSSNIHYLHFPYNEHENDNQQFIIPNCCITFKDNDLKKHKISFPLFTISILNHILSFYKVWPNLLLKSKINSFDQLNNEKVWNLEEIHENQCDEFYLLNLYLPKHNDNHHKNQQKNYQFDDLPSIHLVITLPYRITNFTNQNIILSRQIENQQQQQQQEQKEQKENSLLQISKSKTSTPIQKITSLLQEPPTFAIGILINNQQQNIEEKEKKSATQSYQIWNDNFVQLTGYGISRRIRLMNSKYGLFLFICKSIKKAGCIELIIKDGHVFKNYLPFPIRITFDINLETLKNFNPSSYFHLSPNEKLSFSGPFYSKIQLFRISLNSETNDDELSFKNSICHWTTPKSLFPNELTIRDHINLIYENFPIINSREEKDLIAQTQMITINSCNINEKFYSLFFIDKQPPVLINNETNEFLIKISPIEDKNQENLLFIPFHVLPKQENSFSPPWDNKKIIQKIHISIFRNQINENEIELEFFFILNLCEDKIKKFPVSENYFLFFECKQIGGTFLLTLKEKQEENHEENSQLKKTTNQFNFSIFSKYFSISFIDDRIQSKPKYEEVLLFYLDDLHIEFSKNQNITSLHFSILNYQIESLLMNNERVICCSKNQSNNAHELNKKQKKLDGIMIIEKEKSIWCIKCLSFSLLPFIIQAEDEFMYNLIKLLNYFQLIIQSNQNQTKNNQLDQKRKNNKKFQELQNQSIFINSLHIDEIDIEISISLTFGIFLSLHKTPIHFPSLTLISKNFLPSELAILLTEFYITSSIFKVPQIVASFEILGNPANFIREISAACVDLIQFPIEGASNGPISFLFGVGRGFSSFLLHTSHGTFHSIHAFTSSISRNMEVLSFDKDYQNYRNVERSIPSFRSDQKFIRGVKGFSYGVANGVFGIVSQPVSGGYQNGFSGFMQGLGKGLLGAVTKPVGGAAEFISCTSDALLHSLKSSEYKTRNSCRYLLISNDFNNSNLFKSISMGNYCPSYSKTWFYQFLSKKNLQLLNENDDILLINDFSLNNICFFDIMIFNENYSLCCITLSHLFIWDLSQLHSSSSFANLFFESLPFIVKIPLSTIYSSRHIYEQGLVKFEALHEHKQVSLFHPKPLLRSYLALLVSQLSQSSK